MNRQQELAKVFRDLHVASDPLILFNIWDAGSARVVASAGAKAIATGSWAVAAAYGYPDGQAMPFEFAVENLRRITDCVDLPVSIDLESGYGDSLADLWESVAKVVDAGAIGINIEDLNHDTGELYGVDTQAERITAVREAAEQHEMPLFINARTDCFFRGDPPERHPDLMDEALQRARAYAEAGADGLFVPGLLQEGLLERVCAESPLPVNVMILPNAPAPRRLAELGVSRISYGPGPYSQAMGTLRDTAQQAFTSGTEPVITDWRLLLQT